LTGYSAKVSGDGKGSDCMPGASALCCPTPFGYKEFLMAPTQSRSQRKAAFLQAAGAMYEQLETWYDAHPTATFEEIEAEIRPQRRELVGGLLATLIVGRDSGFQASAPPCPQCQQPMTFEGYRPWTVKGLEGDSELTRAYYVCPTCAGQTFSPSGSETGVAG
jgi:hypothetical protein